MPPSLTTTSSLSRQSAASARQAPLSFADRLLLPAFYAVLVVAAFNTVLRRDFESSVTLYYALTPVLFVALLLSTNWFFKWAIVFVPVAIYGVLTAGWYGTPQDFYGPKLIFFGFLLVFFGVMRFLHLRDPNFNLNIVRILWGLMFAVFVLALTQSITGFRLPNVDPADYGYLTTYFFSANDVALFMSGGLAIVLMRRGPFPVKAALFVAVLMLNAVNDARAAFMAMAIVPVVFYMARATTTFRLPPLIVAGLAGMAVVGIVLGGSAIEFQIGAVRLDLYELLAEPIRRIVQLEDYNLRGSLYDRSDALIINIREFIGTLGLGLGPGGSTYVLSLPEHRLVTAESLHNALAELGVELGVIFLVPFGVWVYRLSAKMMQTAPTRGDVARFAFLCGLPFLGVTQSSGYISNYAFWMVLYLVVAASDDFWGLSPRHNASRLEAQKSNRPVMPWEQNRRY